MNFNWNNAKGQWVPLAKAGGTFWGNGGSVNKEEVSTSNNSLVV